MKDQQEVWGLVDILGQGLSKGGEMVSRVHRSIADESFNILEQVPVTATTSKLVRAIHDQIFGLSYGSVKFAGEALSDLARSRFDVPGEPEPGAEPDSNAEPETQSE